MLHETKIRTGAGRRLVHVIRRSSPSENVRAFVADITDAQVECCSELTLKRCVPLVDRRQPLNRRTNVGTCRAVGTQQGQRTWRSTDPNISKGSAKL